ncbi:MAG: UDP-3-O-(3-hydroxymyristoyl)glucosamine N-acyltransferase [Desulfovibrio sp.]|jgi:UDP-3-O-[3-hydroxymyristoyl] glucosamine N-acyltransferase|nr:UDP-3-O-(3-hydroxymyristoyl)glucosamine N-acyltransferase [Desulfovibrio sp.]
MPPIRSNSLKAVDPSTPDMSMRLSELASAFGLTLVGEDREFTGLNTLEDASETEVSFLANPRYRHLLGATRACAVIVAQEYAAEAGCALVSATPYHDFARVASLFTRRESGFTGISPAAVIHPEARLGAGCTVYPHAYIGARSRIGAGCEIFPGAYVGEDCGIGDGCVLYPNAVVLSGTEMGERCVLRPGAVIGSDGFGFVRAGEKMQTIPQIGAVRLADGVDVGANSCVDRATLGATSIGADSKLDNLVQIGHNVRIGEQCLLISQVGIAGSVKVGDRVTVAGQAGIAGHIHIGDDVTIGPQSGVPSDIPAGARGGGSPFMDRGTFMRVISLLPRLPELHRQVRRLEKELADVKRLLQDATGRCPERTEGVAGGKVPRTD